MRTWDRIPCQRGIGGGAIVVGGSVVVVLLLGILFVRRGASKIKQPIQFNHYIHVKKNGLSCDTCHQNVLQGEMAGKPKIETCSMCHSSSISKSKEEKKVVKYVEQEKEIPWQRLTTIKVKLNFSHRRHVVDGKIKCVQCHGDMPSRKTPPPRALKKIKMNTCIQCHEKKKATTDCNACHR